MPDFHLRYVNKDSSVKAKIKATKPRPDSQNVPKKGLKAKD